SPLSCTLFPSPTSPLFSLLPPHGYHKGGCTGRCAKFCGKHEVGSKTYDCKLTCCTQPKKGK
uniref:Uncharacterized protein n=1 Tax=Pelusios castaneus TaxID=367368 RepID=A0A8C8RQ91_9SAUR